MIKVMLIDDEKLALKALEHLLNQYEDIEIVGVYTDIDEAFEKIKSDKVDVIFLDIEMPKMKGIIAADKIHSINSSINIIFVTAYNNYAIDAFEVHALDYIMKPVLKRRLDKTIERIRNKHSFVFQADSEVVQNKIMCFRNFEIIINNKIVKWRTSKAKELAAYLIYNKGEFVNKDKVIETLWSDKDYNQAIKLLHTNVYYVRKALKSDDIGELLIYSNEMYKINMEKIYCDIFEFEQTIKNAKQINDKNIKKFEKIVSLYRGEYFQENDYLWADVERERLYHIYRNILNKIADFYKQQGECKKVIYYLREIIKKDPYNEEIHEMILNEYLKLKDYKSFFEHYNHLVNVFRTELNIEINNNIKEKYSNILKNK